jgi:membrane-bound lytic murein transglycosylase D
MLLIILQSAYALSYEFPDEISFAGAQIPMDRPDIRERLERIFNIFVHDRRGFFQNLIDRQDQFIPYAKDVLSQFGVNEDFAYVIPVESEFDPRAFSQAQASGPWQLMAATAKMYGLRVDNSVDERNLLEKSSRAAAEHLKMLTNMFGNNPFLILAAYNNGDLNVRTMLQSQKTTDFWDSRSNSETEAYVEKVIIYKILLSDPEKYGFKIPEEKDQGKYEMCTISLGSENLEFSEICRIAGISYRELYRINPHIKFGSYKNGGSISKYTSADIIIPKGKSEAFLNELRSKSMLSGTGIPQIEDPSKTGYIEYYTVRYNDNIESVAFKFGTDWRKIALDNDLKIVTLPSGAETAEVSRGQTLRIAR